jgi:hypothetical protein
MVSFDRARSEALVEHLSAMVRPHATEALERYASLSDNDRSAVAQTELGVRRDVDLRLRQCMAQASAPLQAGIYRALPSFFRSMFPHLATPSKSSSPPPLPTLSAFAHRLAREAIR